MNWNDSQVALLRSLWKDGTKTAEIGNRLGCSKSAAVGKAHRLDLEPRPSPIINSTRQLTPTSPSDNRTVRTRLTPTQPRTVPMPPKPITTQISIEPYQAIVPCRWPIGDPHRKDFRFCACPSEPSKGYCPEHQKLAYVRVRSEREYE
jgi:GcrA cell cycle regulator